MFSRWLWLLEGENLLPPPPFLLVGSDCLQLSSYPVRKKKRYTIVAALSCLSEASRPRPQSGGGRGLEVAPQETTQMRQLQTLLYLPRPSICKMKKEKRTYATRSLQSFCRTFAFCNWRSVFPLAGGEAQGYVVIDYYFCLLLTLKRQTKRLLILILWIDKGLPTFRYLRREEFPLVRAKELYVGEKRKPRYVEIRFLPFWAMVERLRRLRS